MAAHDLHQTSTSPPAWLYRGVVILGNEAGTQFRIPANPAGMPGRWSGVGNIQQLQTVIDAWLDTGRLPAWYRMPAD